MTMVKVHLCPQNLRREIFTTENLASFVQDNFQVYGQTHYFTVPQVGEEAAEEAFDLSQNPSRDEERLRVYRDYRPVCVGDVVECLHRDQSHQFFLCDPIGWTQIDRPLYIEGREGFAL